MILELWNKILKANKSDLQYFGGLSLYGVAYLMVLFGLYAIYGPLLWFGLAAAVAGIGFRMVNHA